MSKPPALVVHRAGDLLAWAGRRGVGVAPRRAARRRRRRLGAADAGPRRPVGRRGHAAARRRAPVHAAESSGCLGKCRSPLGALLGSWRERTERLAPHGDQERHVACVGRCWALMALAVRARRHERHVDGHVVAALDRSRKDPPPAPQSPPTALRLSSSPSAELHPRSPTGAIPAAHHPPRRRAWRWPL